jgi:ADP-heptose:LPS heptosyltransferase
MYIAHNRGPMHISASLGVKTIGIFNSPLASFWFPYKENKCCAYLQKDSVEDITVEEVLETTRQILSDNLRPVYPIMPQL